jgi:hypothetical protein
VVIETAALGCLKKPNKRSDFRGTKNRLKPWFFITVVQSGSFIGNLNQHT